MTDRTEADAVREIAASQTTINVGEISLGIVPPGHALISLERYYGTPTRRRANPVFTDLPSFAHYVSLHKTETQELYYDEDASTFTCIFDAAGWRDDTAVYTLRKSDEWQRWKSQDGKKVDQAEFAAFIENNLPDIIVPDSATVLEVATRLEAKKEVEFASAIRLSDGSLEFTYSEEIQGTTQRGKLEIFQTFMIAIPVFLRQEPIRIDARFRYRIQAGGKLVLWFELVRLHEIERQAVKNMVELMDGTIGTQTMVGKHGPAVRDLMK